MDRNRDRKHLSAGIWHLGLFSTVTNLLILVLPLYMLQVYDRILPSNSINTLVYITGMALLALAVLGVLEVVRQNFANRMAARLDRYLGADLFLAAMTGPKAGLGDVQPLRDLATIRGFVASRSLFFVFDLPFAPLFIIILYFIHPLLFYITIAGAAAMLGVALINQVATAASNREANETLSATMNSAQTFGRNFETVRALGMVSNILNSWGNRFAASLRASDGVAATNSFWGGVSRTVRFVLQIATLGAGAWLVLQGEITAGMIFAASMISSRALQPLDQIIGGWRQITDVWGAWKRIRPATWQKPGPDRFPLPAPKGELTLSNLVYYPPDAPPNAAPLIKGVNLGIDTGETVAIMGPSQAGKSTLARLMVGAIRPRTGTVRLDGADIGEADPDELGRHIGYLSQEVELFPGTIAENISRFDPSPPEGEVIRAAQRSHAHALILSQRNDYSTLIGPGGVRLSGGERQRIGLARAFYGDPRLLVLDEPNANLDGDGELALERAILEAKAQGTTVILITHRPALAAKCDKVLVLRDGRVEGFGPANEVLARLAQQAQRGVPTELRPPPRTSQAS